MGYLSQINDMAKAITNIPNMTLKDLDDRMAPHKSFAKGAMDGTLQFPCLVSDAIPIDMASTIARTLERAYASFVQVYLSLNNTIDISVDKNPSEFLKRFHKNIKLESTAVDWYYENCTEPDQDFDTLMERIYNGTTKAFINEKENMIIAFNFSDKFSPAVYESNKRDLEQSLKDIDFTPFANVGNSPFYAKEAPLFTPQDAHDIEMDIIKKTYTNELDRAKAAAITRAGDAKTRLAPALTDNDVKKANDFQPYTMQVRLMAVNDQNEFVQFMDFIIGIKVVLHNIKSNEMVVNIQNSLQNSGKLFNLIRWTTGEKSLFKDLIFRINEVKLDVANKSKGASPWWSTLKRLKDTSKAQQAFFSRTQIVPNSTIVVSQYEVDTIQKAYGFSLRDPRFAKKLMSNLFLMNFVIVDDGTRTVDILYDGASTYQTYALETLEREVTANSNKIGRELTRMISR